MDATKKIKVLFITHTYGMGGANHSLFQLMKELKENYDVYPTLLVPKGVHPYPITEKCKEIGVEVILTRFYWFKGTGYSIKNILRLALNFFLFYPIVIWKLRGRKFDIIHSNGSVIDIGVFVNYFKKSIHVWHLREMGEKDFGVRSLLGKVYERWVYKHGDRFIAISNCVKNEYQQIISSSKIELIYNGVIPKSCFLHSEHKNKYLQFVLVGVIQEAKNQIEAVRAFSMVIKSGREAYLNFIGTENDEYVLELKKIIDQTGIVNYVKFWGAQKNVPEILKTMDVGLMLSRNEAFGRVTVEYMLQNIAVIASDAGANPEIIENYKSGLLYPYGNYKQLSNKMIELIDNPQLCIEIADAGQKQAIERFTSTRNSKDIYSLYMKLLS